MKPHWPASLIHYRNLISNDGQDVYLNVFAYGSLIWNPGFEYDNSFKASAHGYSRRFYQGNKTHRGNEDLPGRVATIVRDSGDSVPGLVYRIDGLDAILEALEHLHGREIMSGYVFESLDVQLHDSDGTISAVTVIAQKDNDLYLGPSPTIAEDIALAEGRAGPNHVYLYKLADSMRKHFPLHHDSHLYQLEISVKRILQS